jgi:hypothetical protein
MFTVLVFVTLVPALHIAELTIGVHYLLAFFYAFYYLLLEPIAGVIEIKALNSRSFILLF